MSSDVPLAAVFCVLVVLIAGCGGVSRATPVTQNRGTAARTERLIQSANPWQFETTVVGVNSNGYEGDGCIKAVENAVEYWESRETGLDLEFRVDPGNQDPDIEISYRPQIGTCGNGATTGTVPYCTDSHDENDRATGVTTTAISGGYTASTTTQIVKAGFGTMLPVDGPTDPSDFSNFDACENRDPWPEPRTVVIGSDQSASDRNVTPLVAGAVAYWEPQNASVKNYTTDFSVEPDARSPSRFRAKYSGVDLKKMTRLSVVRIHWALMVGSVRSRR